MPRPKSPRNIILVLIPVLVLIFVALFVARGWIRTTGVTWYANTFYQPTIAKRFDVNFKYVNEQFKTLGITVDQPDFDDGCGGSQFENIHISMGCTKTRVSGKTNDDDQFVKNWQQQSKTFEHNLLAKGWVRINDVNQDITHLLDRDTFQPEIMYKLNQGKINCYTRIGFNKYDVDDRRVFVEEGCDRSVLIFGGY